jgi:hypothetical protein
MLTELDPRPDYVTVITGTTLLHICVLPLDGRLA